MDIRKDYLYTKEHEWVSVDGDVATVGITDFAQSELGDVVFVEYPDLESEVTQFDPFGTIEAVKTVADLYAPVSGTVVEVNDNLEDQPELVNQDPYGEGWMVKIRLKDPAELDALLSPLAYEELTAE
ncbi:MAG: glycine cleavage system protein GcvH [Candidatus Neomarinimicrobiota bacterium]|nr:MAG: glycine cleavage system protein GcvH [Candidatus Neomarinimicrobiota bacterium]